MPLRTADVFRNDIVTVPELLSDGYGANSIYLSAVVSTTSATQTITINLPEDEPSLQYAGEYQVNPGDIIYLYDTQPGGIADGYYTVNSVSGATTVLVNEPLPNSTDGYIQFRFTSGASTVGFDNSSSCVIEHNTVQGALEDLDAAVCGSTSSGLTPEQHASLRQLIHLADGVGGPFEGFTSGAYRTVTGGLLTPTLITWYSDHTQTVKIVDKTITYNDVLQPTVIRWQCYASDGVTVLSSVTDTITYDVIFETSRTRSIANYAIYSGYLTPETHESLRQLIHLADGVGGPFEEFASGAYREIQYPYGSPFYSVETWYTDSNKIFKIVQNTIIRNTINMPTTITWSVYDIDGITILSTVSDTIIYQNNIFEVSRTRMVS
jgi:hypothetical protein